MPTEKITEADNTALARHLAGWDVIIDEYAADCDGNGRITDWDAVLLSRKLAGWSVDLSENETIDLSDGYVIVHGENAYISEITAATELRKYLKKISGVDISIVSDTTEPTEKEIVVGKTNRETDGMFDRAILGDEGVAITTVNDKLFVVGGEQRGTLYAVYELLEKFFDCRFYTDEVENVPERTDLIMPKVEDYLFVPVFEYRDLPSQRVCTASNSPKLRVNGAWSKTTDKEGGQLSYYVGFCHTFFTLVPPAVYSETHPEYYSWYDGSPRQLCMTNPEVLEIAKRSVRKTLEANPDAKILSVTQMDNQNPCGCENCLKAYEEENRLWSGVVLRFVNAIADDIKDDYPEAKIDTFAYLYTRSVSTVTKPADNVIVRLCSIECCFSHPFEECGKTVMYGTNPENSFLSDLENWSEISDNLYIWNYSGNFTDCLSPCPNFGVLRKNMRTFADNGVKGMYEQVEFFDTAMWGEFGVLRACLLARLMWDPYMTEAEYQHYINQALFDLYGEGAGYLKQFIDLESEVTKDIHVSCLFHDANYIYPITVNKKENTLPDDLTYDMIVNYEDTDWSKYYNWYHDVVGSRLITEGEMLFDNAYELANDKQKARIDVCRLQIDVLKSYYYYEALKTIKRDVSVLIKDYFAETGLGAPEGMTDLQFRNTVAAYVYNKATEEYMEYNRELHSNLLAAGYLRLGEWDPIPANLTDSQLQVPPASWK